METVNKIISRNNSFPRVHMTFEYWLHFVYGYSPWEYDEHIQKLKIAYKQIHWSKYINTGNKQ
jgi:hypothetical protein